MSYLSTAVTRCRVCTKMHVLPIICVRRRCASLSQDWVQIAQLAGTNLFYPSSQGAGTEMDVRGSPYQVDDIPPLLSIGD